MGWRRRESVPLKSSTSSEYDPLAQMLLGACWEVGYSEIESTHMYDDSECTVVLVLAIE